MDPKDLSISLIGRQVMLARVYTLHGQRFDMVDERIPVGASGHVVAIDRDDKTAQIAFDVEIATITWPNGLWTDIACLEPWPGDPVPDPTNTPKVEEWLDAEPKQS
jgi:hypothetical protein